MSWIHQNEIFDVQYRSAVPYGTPSFHSHTNYEVYLFHEGRVQYLIGDRIYMLEPGDLIIMNGLTLHRPIIDTRTPYVRSILHFDARFVNSIDPARGEGQEGELLRPFVELKIARLKLSEERRIEAEQRFMHMETKLREQSYAGRQRAKIAMLDLLYCIYDWFSEPLAQLEHQRDRERHVEEVIRVLEQRYTEELSLDEIAQEVHLNKHYVSKLFKEITGFTIFQYVNHRRINQAKVMFVAEPQVPVTEVSYAVGYKHLPHFSRMFKQIVGCTPEAYRKKVQLQMESYLSLS